MKIKILNNKSNLVVLGVMLIIGIIFSVVQIVKAGVTGPHNPGHTWATIDKPADCSSGYYVRGADDSSWLCSPLPASGISDCYTTYSTNSIPGNNCVIGITSPTCNSGYRVTGGGGLGGALPGIKLIASSAYYEGNWRCDFCSEYTTTYNAYCYVRCCK
jgi:hypothetical protein